jgi:nitric oxide reductase subunit B
MPDEQFAADRLSPGWRWGVIVTLVIGFALLIYISFAAYGKAPPVPESVVGPDGRLVFTGQDVQGGQQVFLKYALMENGTIWGHGAYLGPDFSAEYLHSLAMDACEELAHTRYNRSCSDLTERQQNDVRFDVRTLLRANRYDPGTGRLHFTHPEASSYRKQVDRWTNYFSGPAATGGLPTKYIRDPEELRKLTAFFAWTAWASAANRPGKSYSYTNNFPYEPLVGNTPTSDAFLWSALSLVGLLAGIALVLFAFGRFRYLGWRGRPEEIFPRMLTEQPTESQKATVKYFVVLTLLFLAQVLAGGATAHFRAEPGSFYGLDLAKVFPSNILRTWHLQLAIFWIATGYIGGGLVLAPALGGREPAGQKRWIDLLFWALVLVVAGSLLGEILGINDLLGKVWFWFGHQGWEYLDLGRGWQALLALGLILWLILLYRGVAPARRDPERREISILFLLGAAAIPFFYLPAFLFDSVTNYTVVDTWRFWIIHLWVEGFFELFVTVMVAVTFFQLGVVARTTAVRIIYLDVILFLGSGLVGTAHHWYWTGQSNVAMALAAMFSALEVVPLLLLTLDAWDFVRLTRLDRPKPDRPDIPYKWAFFFLMAVGFWNFVGAGIFGFLINLPIVSYFEVGTLLTPNHGHAALMGAFGMLALAFTVLGLRQVSTREQWARHERYVKVSFWGLNIGLALMVILNLFPGGVLQVWDVMNRGYWHARSLDYLSRDYVRLLEWLRMPADLIFIIFGVLPLATAAVLTYRQVRTSK